MKANAFENIIDYNKLFVFDRNYLDPHFDAVLNITHCISCMKLVNTPSWRP